MNRESVLLALTGAMLGVLALSAVLAAKLHPRPPAAEPEASALLGGGPAGESGFEDGEAVPVMAEDAPETPPEAGEPTASAETEPRDEPSAGPFYVALRVPDPIPGERLFVCDGAGCPLDAVLPDRNGDAAAGPFPPGRYSVCRGETEIGRFRLRDNAALDEAEGRLWTDGELLWIERFSPGSVRLTVTLPGPGWYALRLWDRDGRQWSRDLCVAADAPPEAGGTWTRALEYRGLPPGTYTVVHDRTVCARVEVAAGETASAAVVLEKPP